VLNEKRITANKPSTIKTNWFIFLFVMVWISCYSELACLYLQTLSAKSTNQGGGILFWDQEILLLKARFPICTPMAYNPQMKNKAIRNGATTPPFRNLKSNLYIFWILRIFLIKGV
jgi:hypothetical protein